MHSQFFMHFLIHPHFLSSNVQHQVCQLAILGVICILPCDLPLFLLVPSISVHVWFMLEVSLFTCTHMNFI